MTEEDVDRWRAQFHVPDATELAGGDIADPPPEWSNWLEWAGERWPSLSDE
jgi:hypothetical protein